jgi:hypothetical protein
MIDLNQDRNFIERGIQKWKDVTGPEGRPRQITLLYPSHPLSSCHKTLTQSFSIVSPCDPSMHSISDLTTYCRKTTGDVPARLVVSLCSIVEPRLGAHNT